MSRHVVVNVGGVCFLTTESTLSSSPYFRSLLRSYDDSTTTAASGDACPTLFIDRDPTHFRHVLNSLRGSNVVPFDAESLFELRVEADFYNLSHFVGCIDAALHAHPGSQETTLASMLVAMRGMRR